MKVSNVAVITKNLTQLHSVVFHSRWQAEQLSASEQGFCSTVLCYIASFQFNANDYSFISEVYSFPTAELLLLQAPIIQAHLIRFA